MTSKKYTREQFIFTITIFLSACLLFFIQPLFAKLVLPILGGSSSVWTTAMLFFQSVLVLGYIYAHLSTKYLPTKWQVGLHIILWACALAFMPISVKMDWVADPSSISTSQTLLIFTFGVGAPFAVLAANAPLIQKWYSKTDGPSSDDPYFLYSASNVGSLLALLAFPFVAEPLLGASTISNLWSLVFIIFGVCLFVAGFMASRASQYNKTSNPTHTIAQSIPTFKLKLFWVLLAAIPSSMMLSVTTKVSTDFGSFPLVWVIPLALYLVTFIYAFSGKAFFSIERQRIWIAGCLFIMLLITIGGTNLTNILLLFSMMLAAFFFIALVAHKRIYDTRPSEEYLTQFYILISIGGALGGFFNSVVATNFFNDIYEMPIIMALSCILLSDGFRKVKFNKIIIHALIAAVVIIIALYTRGFFNLSASTLKMLLFSPILLFIFTAAYRKQAWKAALWSATLILTTSFIVKSNYIFHDRSFFGIHRVYNEDDTRVYSNGTTVHGAQLISEDTEKPTPLTYYHPKGPMGQIFTSEFANDFQSVGIVGLGVGSLVCYKQPSQDWHLYEIDKIVDEIARNKSLFTFMSSCAEDTPTFIGDARLVMTEKPDDLYDILVIDAFSSDAIPVHLLTLEALELYMSKLKSDGILVLHISNRFFSLVHPIAHASKHMNVEGLNQLYVAPEDTGRTNSSSQVIVLGKPSAKWTALKSDERWKPLTTNYNQLWTDDYANLLSVLK